MDPLGGLPDGLSEMPSSRWASESRAELMFGRDGVANFSGSHGTEIAVSVLDRCPKLRTDEVELCVNGVAAKGFVHEIERRNTDTQTDLCDYVSVVVLSCTVAQGTMSQQLRLQPRLHLQLQHYWVDGVRGIHSLQMSPCC